jgi:hypothetical protein
MGKFELKEGQGSLFVNERKETDRHPDWTGAIMLNGKEHWLNAWTKTGRGGQTFYSLSVGKEKQARQERPTQQDRAIANGPGPSDPNDSIPFMPRLTE